MGSIRFVEAMTDFLSVLLQLHADAGPIAGLVTMT